VKRASASQRDAGNLLAAISFLPILAGAMSAGTLKSETVEAWDRYIDTASARMQQRLSQGASFLWVDESPDRLASVKNGDILVSPADPSIPRKVPFGLIHDWMGAAFLPNTTLEQVVSVTRDYPHYKEFYPPGLLESKALSMSPSEDRFWILAENRSILTRTALDSDYKSDLFRLDRQRAYCITQSTRIQEIQDYGSQREHMLPADQGYGFLWRVLSITRYQQRDGGVYMEVEAMALSRDIPFSLRWIIDPVVRRVSRGSLFTSIKQTGDAVRSASLLSHRSIAPAPSDTGTSHKSDVRSQALKPQ
jgi:hypothetical protein